MAKQPKQFRGLRTGGQKSSKTSFIRTKVTGKPSTKPNFPLRKRVNKENRTLTHIASNKRKANQLAKQERKMGKNATVVSGKKLKQGPRLVVTSGRKFGRAAVFTSPKKKRNSKKRKR